MGDAHGLGSAALDGPGGEGPLLAFLRVLSDGSDPATLGSALAHGLLHELGPTQVSAYFLDHARTHLDELVTYGMPTEGVDYSRVPLDLRMPLTQVVRTGEAGAWTMADAAAEYPLIAGWVQAQPHRAGEEVYIVPIRAEGRVAGALLVSLPEPTERTWRLRMLLDAAAQALGVWARGLHPRTAPRGRRTAGTSVTERQTRIVEGIRLGRSNKEIAAELSVSVGTVKADLAQLYRTFGVSDREALVGLVASVL